MIVFADNVHVPSTDFKADIQKTENSKQKVYVTCARLIVYFQGKGMMHTFWLIEKNSQDENLPTPAAI